MTKNRGLFPSLAASKTCNKNSSSGSSMTSSAWKFFKSRAQTPDTPYPAAAEEEAVVVACLAVLEASSAAAAAMQAGVTAVVVPVWRPCRCQ